MRIFILPKILIDRFSSQAEPFGSEGELQEQYFMPFYEKAEKSNFSSRTGKNISM